MLKIKKIIAITLMVVVTWSTMTWQGGQALAATCTNPEYNTKLDGSYTEKEILQFVDKAHMTYHSYVNCEFQNVSDTILPPLGKAADPSKDLDLTCKPEGKLTDTMKKTDVVGLMERALGAYNNYSDYLDKIVELFPDHLKVEGRTTFDTYLDPAIRMEALVKKEKNYSLLAIDRSLVNFNGMRQAYLIHNQLKCVASKLQKYLTLLGKLRTIVSALPRIIENASIH